MRVPIELKLREDVANDYDNKECHKLKGLAMLGNHLRRQFTNVLEETRISAYQKRNYAAIRWALEELGAIEVVGEDKNEVEWLGIDSDGRAVTQ